VVSDKPTTYSHNTSGKSGEFDMVVTTLVLIQDSEIQVEQVITDDQSSSNGLGLPYLGVLQKLCELFFYFLQIKQLLQDAADSQLSNKEFWWNKVTGKASKFLIHFLSQSHPTKQYENRKT
jgi:hypothetical protein